MLLLWNLISLRHDDGFNNSETVEAPAVASDDSPHVALFSSLFDVQGVLKWRLPNWTT